MEGELGLGGGGGAGGKDEGMFFAPGQGEAIHSEGERHFGGERQQQQHRHQQQGGTRGDAVDAVRQHHPAHRTDQSPYTQNGMRGKERADGMRRSRRK